MNDLNANAPKEQTETPPRQRNREKVFRGRIVKYEKLIAGMLRSLELPDTLHGVVRALIVASNGETEFEASYNDLKNVLFLKKSKQSEADKDNVKYRVKTLLKWQNENRVELVRVIEKGRKLVHDDGTVEFVKTKYQLILLNEIVKILSESRLNEQKFAAKIDEAVKRMKGDFVPEKKNFILPPWRSIEKDRKTLNKKFEKIIAQAAQEGWDYFKYGQRIIDDLQTAFDELTVHIAELSNKDKRISDFKNGISRDFSNAYENEGGGKDDINFENQQTEILSSFNHLRSNRGDGNFYPDIDNFSEFKDIDQKIKVIEGINSKNEGYLNYKSLKPEISNLEVALHYASFGIAVFPVHSLITENGIERCSCRKWIDCLDAAKHPRTRNGVLDATTDEAQIREWWEKHPDSNIGISTGRESGIFVLDVDVNTGGEYSLSDLQDAYGSLPATLTSITGSGGRHYVFRYPSDVRLKNSTSAIGLGLDVKSDNGYVVAPPSIHKCGRQYQWHGFNTPILNAPDWLIAVILDAEEHSSEVGESGTIRNSIRFSVSDDRKVTQGNRNEFLHKQASGLVNSFSTNEVARRVHEKNQAFCFPPLDNREIEKILKSAEKYR